MNSVYMFFGQCGCQIGTHMLKKLEEQKIYKRMFCSKENFRGIFIDCDSYVLKDILVTFRQNRYIKTEKFNIVKSLRVKSHSDISKQHIETIMNALMYAVHLVENCQQVYLFHSIAGKFGSTAACSLIPYIQEKFQSYLKIYSVSVLPFTSGESSLQHYYSLLTLSKLHRHADGIIVLKNDQMMQSVQSKANILFEMNRLIIEKFISMILPCSCSIEAGNSSSGKMKLRIFDMETENLSLSNYLASAKNQFWQIDFIDFESFHDPCRSLRSLLRRRNMLGENKCKVTFFVLLVDDEKNLSDMSCEKYHGMLGKLFPHLPQTSKHVHLARTKHIAVRNVTNSRLTILYCSKEIMSCVENITMKANNMFRLSAFLHHFKSKEAKDEISKAIEYMQHLLN